MACYASQNNKFVRNLHNINAPLAGRDEAGWIVAERWEQLRKLGQAAGWLVTHDQVLLSPT